MFIRGIPTPPSSDTPSGGTFLAGDGTAGAPSYSFSSDTTTGMYLPSAGNLGFSTGGTLRVTMSSTSVTSTVPFYGPNGSSSAPSFTWSGDSNTGMYNVGADQIGLTTGGTLRFTVDGSTSITSTLPFYGPAGSNSTPAYTFSADPDTGLYHVGANQAGIATGGTLRLTVDGSTSITSTLPFYAPDGAVGSPAYTFSADTDSGFYRIGANNIGLTLSGVKAIDFAPSAVTVTQATSTSGQVTAWTVTTGTLSGLSASTDLPDVLYDLASTKTFATGAKTNQKAFVINAPTWAAVGATTITNGAVLYISGAPTAGTNVTITNAYSLWCAGSGTIARFDGSILIGASQQFSFGSLTTGASIFVSGGDFVISSGPSGSPNIFKYYSNIAGGSASPSHQTQSNVNRAANDVLHRWTNNVSTAVIAFRADGRIDFVTAPTQTTVGAAGGASAPPATPDGYLVALIAGTEKVLPYYAKS